MPRADDTAEITSDLDTARAALFADLDDPTVVGSSCRRRYCSQLAAFVAPSTAPERAHPTTFVITEQEPDECIAVRPP